MNITMDEAIRLGQYGEGIKRQARHEVSTSYRRGVEDSQARLNVFDPYVKSQNSRALKESTEHAAGYLVRDDFTGLMV